MAEMDIDFAEILKRGGRAERLGPAHHRRRAADGARARRAAARSTTTRMLTSKDTRDIIYAILSNDQRKRLEKEWQVDFSYSVPRYGRFRVNAYMQRASVGAAFRLIPSEIKSVDQLGLPPRHPRVREEAAWLRARHGPDRIRQVDLARGDDRRDQPDAQASTSSRSRTRSSSCTATRSAW